MPDPESFQRYVAALPRQYEPDLVTSDTVSTAFYLALSAGWTESELIADTQRTLVRGAGVGAVVSRLRTLAATKPIAGRGQVVTLHPIAGVTSASGYCACGVAPAHPVNVLPAEWMLARAALLRRCDEEHIEEERAERLMADLIAHQREGEREPEPTPW